LKIKSNFAGDTPIINKNYKNLFFLNAENYQKGALFLHALRKYIGDNAFFKGIKVYYHKFKHSNVTTGDFKQVMQEVANKNLNVLFDEWLNDTGLPVE
jgi:aminopeptidase N